MVFPDGITEVPAWQYDGLLPVALGPDVDPASCSPYRVALRTLVQHFGITAHRRSLLRGLLAFRDELRGCGWHSGFQWLNGSFLEDVERVDPGCVPNDIDVVSFLYSREVTDKVRARQLISADGHIDIRSRFHMDSYVVDLDDAVEKVIRWSIYWHNVWGHRKDSFREKGFVEVSFAEDHADALSLLDHLDRVAS